MDRVILHCDCNAFYASVETVLDPSLKAGPMAVCGDPESRHGIILAKNEAAKAFDIRTAETVWQAKRKCPQLRLVAPHREEYLRFSRAANEIYQQYTDLVDPFGIDESFLDVTGSCHLFGTGPQIADELRRRMREELGLTISVGVSWNRAFAKLGSDYRKPDATTVISRENYQDIVWPLSVSALLYVGRGAGEKLRRLGITTIGELAACDRAALRAQMGRLGELISVYARGEDKEPVHSFYEQQPVKSVGKGCTFAHDLIHPEEVRWQVTALCDHIGQRLRRKQMKFQTVQVTLRDPEFHNISRQETLEVATDSTRILTERAMGLIFKHWKAGRPLRMITVTAAGLTSRETVCEQMSLFDTEAAARRRRQETIDYTMDTLRGRFGSRAVCYGRTLSPFQTEDQSPQQAPKKKSSDENGA